MSSPAVLDSSDRPMRRPADSAVGMTLFAPDCRRISVFCASRTAATMVAFGDSRRAVSVTRIEVSSSSVATTMRLRPLDRGVAEHVLASSVADDADEAVARRLVDGLAILRDDDDLGRRRARVDERLVPRRGP